MECRWETSTKPLFVKTVWNRDHHHVILEKGDPLEVIEIPKSTRSRKNSGLKRPNQNQNSERSNCENLTVSKINFFISSTQSKSNLNYPSYIPKSEEPNHPSKSCPKLKNLTENMIRTKKERKKSSTNFDSGQNHQSYNDANILSPYFSYNRNNGDRYNTTLSERVITWMNLTQTIDNFQGGGCDKEIKKRAVTAHVCNNQSKQVVYVNERKYKLNSAPRSQIKGSESELDDDKLSYTNEDSPASSVHYDGKKTKASNVRRQLHIFMPDIPKKGTDCDSTMSTKSSSLLVRPLKSAQ